MKIYRVIVRGHFDQLDEATIERLRAAQEDHHFLKSAFTADGTLTYDEQLVAFNIRYEIRTDGDHPKDTDLIGEQAIAQAKLWLAELGYTYRRLTANVTDMASMWD